MDDHSIKRIVILSESWSPW